MLETEYPEEGEWSNKELLWSEENSLYNQYAK